MSPANFRAPAFDAFDSHRLVLGNGGDLSVKPAPPPAPHEPVTLLFMAGEGQKWHGVDKLPLQAKASTDWRILALRVEI